MNLPTDISLPFFAYGLFKPGQLCFYRIKDFVEKTADYTVNGILKERDGMPLLIESNDFKIKGKLIYFQKGKAEEAFKRIVEIEPEKVYRWADRKVDRSAVICGGYDGQIREFDEEPYGGIIANVLLGRREERGSRDLEGETDWDGRNDPLFKQGLEEVEDILRKNSGFDWEYKSLFRLQMAYLLLWSAIERYAGLRYHLGKNALVKVKQIAQDDCFVESLKKNVKEKREVYDAVDLDKYKLDPDNP